MTKKVLISLDDFTKILGCEGRTFYDGCGDPDLEHMKNFKAWFDAQPDIHDIISDAVKDGIEKAKESFIQAAILRMQTTGGKDDN